MPTALLQDLTLLSTVAGTEVSVLFEVDGLDSLQLERRYFRGALVALNKEELPLYQHILTIKP